MKKLIFLIALPLVVQAGVICVDNDNASVQNGSSTYPYSSIQTAITNATGNDTIKVAAGNYGQIDNLGKSLVILGGYQGGTPSSYSNGTGGNFTVRTPDPTLTVISGGAGNIGVKLTRFDENPFSFVFDNFTVSNSLKGVVCDTEVSWPHVENVTISNNIIENNGQPGVTTYGAGLLVAGLNHLVSNNIIRNNHGGRGPGICRNGVPDFLVIEGNLIENNTGYDDHAGGIYLDGDVTIRNNIISGNYLQNSYGWGGGVLILGTAHLSYNVIKNNFCPSYGAAVFVDEGGTAYMDNELIYGNHTSYTDWGGAGVALDYGDPGSSYVYMTNCTIANNYSPGSSEGNAVFVDGSSFCTLKNCIMYGNGDDFFVTTGSELTATYTLSQEGITGQGNFSADPLFVDALNEDFHLKSLGGRYDPTAEDWVIDDVHSPAIDAGDPASAYDNEPQPNGSRINLGSYGNTYFSSKSLPVSVQEHLLNEGNPGVSVYPNPSYGFITLNVNFMSFQYGILTLFNAAGEQVYHAFISDSQTDIALSLTKGMYFYEITDENYLIGSGKLFIR
ncbi:MAG: right-handed parallel beta-helix repeat-containing protein [Sphingobacteriales bacterium]|nr:MAG: right-handed parallel beta-helix repeat-containing protein [Sphingobacteriales bacterium]